MVIVNSTLRGNFHYYKISASEKILHKVAKT